MYESHADPQEEQLVEAVTPVEHEHEREEIFEAVTPLVVVADLPTPSAEADEEEAHETEADEAELDAAATDEEEEIDEPAHNGHHASVGEPERDGHVAGGASAEATRAASANGIDSHPLVPTGQSASAGQVTSSAPSVSAPAAAEARGLLEGIAESLRTLAGRQGTDGTSVAIFPRGVDLLEVRMHVARDQAIDLNFRVAGPTAPSLSD